MKLSGRMHGPGFNPQYCREKKEREREREMKGKRIRNFLRMYFLDAV
jgi:hypothetical protein